MQQSRKSMKPLLVAGAIGVTLSLLVSNVVQQQMDGKLVSGGKPAPTFALRDPKGQPVTLSDVISGRKAVLVNFWFYS
jgi:cytochrome oxidase Cu insertion factor (SCO1/SenC/PrrC family)